MYETINSPINYGGLELKNRIIFAPTTFGLSDDAYFEKIRKIAAGGCAMIIIGDVPVGKSQFEKSLFDKKGSHIIRNWLRLSILLLKKGFRICWRKPFFCIVLYPLKSAKALAIKSIGGEDIDGSSFCKFGVCPMLCFSKYSCTICSIKARSVC